MKNFDKEKELRTTNRQATNADKKKTSAQLLGLLSAFANLIFGPNILLKPSLISINSTLKELHKYFNGHGITDNDFREKVLDKNAKYQRLDEKFYLANRLRQDLGLSPIAQGYGDNYGNSKPDC